MSNSITCFFFFLLLVPDKADYFQWSVLLCTVLKDSWWVCSIFWLQYRIKSVQNLCSHFEYVEKYFWYWCNLATNQRGLHCTCPDRPSLMELLSWQWDTFESTYVLWSVIHSEWTFIVVIFLCRIFGKTRHLLDLSSPHLFLDWFSMTAGFSQSQNFHWNVLGWYLRNMLWGNW